MDSVNKAMNTASHVIWGDNNDQSQRAEQSHEEPLSGVQGKGIISDPYDAGNRDEQPDAPASEENTAPQEPKVEGRSQSVPSSAIHNASPTATAGAPSTNATADATAANLSSDTATAGSSSNSVEDTSASTKAEDKEQRDTESTQNNNNNDNTNTENTENAEDDEKTQAHTDQGRRGTTVIMEDHGVSKEALKGPQGPAPHTADEFENDEKKEGNDAQPAESKGESGTSSKGSEKSGNGKPGAMSKMKEGLKKVAHPRHG